MQPDKIKKELDSLWEKYQVIINANNPTWEKVNEARAILFLTGQIYCEKIAVEAIERRLHLLNVKLSLIQFLDLIDKNSNRLEQLRKDVLFVKLEKFYRVIKGYKNKYLGGKYYLEEERFIKTHNKINPHKESIIDYRSSFNNSKNFK